MPPRAFNPVEHSIDKRSGDLFVKEIAHRIHKDALRPLPTERLCQPFGSERDVEAVLKRMVGDATKPLREALRVAIVTASRDLGAPGDRVPSCVSPLDLCCSGHRVILEQNKNTRKPLSNDT